MGEARATMATGDDAQSKANRGKIFMALGVEAEVE